MTILDEILAHKRDEVRTAKRSVSPEEMADRAAGTEAPIRGLARALRESERPRIIAEIKRSSPSRGEIRPDFDPLLCAKSYSDAGAAAISVLTDERYFGGSLEVLARVREAVSIPLLRKEFIVDPYQIDEARAAGADAVLLIVRALSGDLLGSLHAHALSRGLDVLVEVHDAAELESALAADAQIVGINNRNLDTFEVDLKVSEELAQKIPRDRIIVAESGIHETADIQRLEVAGADAFLVGEALMREPDLGAALRRLRGRT